MTAFRKPVTGRGLVLGAYRRAQRMCRDFRASVFALETVARIDPRSAGLLVFPLVLEAANLALFFHREPGQRDLVRARARLEALPPSALRDAAAALARLALSPSGPGDGPDIGAAVLAGHSVCAFADQAASALLRASPFGVLDRWLVPLLENKVAAVMALTLAAVAATAFWPLLFPPSNFEKRLADLQGVKRLLDQYHRDNGSYPVTNAFVGLYSGDPSMAGAWIPGLTPSYSRLLPRDPREDADPAHQYLYNSNGKEYKLIAHNPEDCEAVKKTRPQLVDPVRDCHAYGLWTSGARDW